MIEFKNKFDAIFTEDTNRTVIQYMQDSGDVKIFSRGDIADFVVASDKWVSKAGLKAGDRIALVAPHSPTTIITGVALAYSCITTVLIDAALPIQEINRLIESSDVRALFTVPLIFEQLEVDLTGMPVVDIEKSDRGYILFEGVAERSQRSETADPMSDVVAILYSSGTTTSMRGVMYTYHSLLGMVPKTAYFGNLNKDTTYLHVMPFNHIAGYTSAMSAIFNECEMGFVEKPDATKLAKAFQWYKPTHFGIVPRVYEAMEQKIRMAVKEKGTAACILFAGMLNLSGFMRKTFGINIGRVLFKSVRKQVFGENITLIFSGATLYKESTCKFFLNLGIDLANIYALTETGLPITSTGPYDKYPVSTVGNINRFEGSDIIIVGADSEGIGEICVKTDLMMKGYFREPELTTQAFNEDGYFKTGDLGRIDPKGNLRVTGRVKESIVLHTGKKIAPTDVESVYGALIPHTSFAVAGIPSKSSPDYDDIHIFIEEDSFTGDDKQGLRDKIMDFSAKTVSMYAITGIHFIEKLPLTSVGKVKRYLLKDMMSEVIVSKVEEVKPRKFKGSISAAILTIAARYANGQNVTLDSQFKYELSFDSLTMLELCCDVEETLNVTIANDMSKVETVRDLVTLVEGGKGDGISQSVGEYPLKKTGFHILILKLFLWAVRRVWKLEITGIEHIPTDGRYILCPNHQSNLDSLSVLSALDRSRQVNLGKVCCLVKETFAKSKFGLAIAGGIPVERSGNTIPAMKRGLECLEKGYTMLVHPEGTRSKDGKIKEFKGGAAKLAIDAGVSVIPVRIEGAYDIYPPHKKLPKIFRWGKRYSIRVSFGEPIKSLGKSVDELTAQLQLAVEGL